MTSTELAPAIATKLGGLLRLLLSSDRPGEVNAAVAAIHRVLRANGLDAHALAQRVEHANGNITEAEMKLIYDAGFRAGQAAKEDHHGDDFRNLDGSSSWEAMASWCRRHADQLGESEQRFIRSVSVQLCWWEPSDRQGKWLKGIFYKLGGRL
jgi:hypothetical protein